MPTVNDIFERNERGRCARAGYCSKLVLLATGACLCFGLALWAQTSGSQTDDANKSWTTTRELQSDNVNPTRTTESHSHSGNRTVDKQSTQRRGSDGNSSLTRTSKRNQCR